MEYRLHFRVKKTPCAIKGQARNRESVRYPGPHPLPTRGMIAQDVVYARVFPGKTARFARLRQNPCAYKRHAKARVIGDGY